MSQFVAEFQYVIIIIIIIFNRVQPGEHILFELITKIPLNYNLCNTLSVEFQNLHPLP